MATPRLSERRVDSRKEKRFVQRALAPYGKLDGMAAVYYLAWAIAVVLVAVGVYALVNPKELARRYGVAAHGHDAAAFVRATGIRDVALGVVLGAAAYLHALVFVIVLGIVGLIVSVADFRIVSHHGGEHGHRAAHAIHASGVIAFILIITMALFALGR
jgi:hypothetical protein